MMIEHLHIDLIESLKDAKQVYVAVALMKDFGLDSIESAIPAQCKRSYLVGIDLPTTPSVLRKLIDFETTTGGLLTSRVWSSKQVYHPKVYLIQRKSGKWLAYVGSANATRGGFTSNIELNVEVTDEKSCQKILRWFNRMFLKKAMRFDSRFVSDYEILYKRNKVLESTRKSNNAGFDNRSSLNQRAKNIPDSQFFQKSDFDAFAPNTHFQTDNAALAKRERVKERMKELNRIITLHFAEYGLLDLNNHPWSGNITSQTYHSRGNTHLPKQSIWLHYGKPKAELLRYPKGHNDFGNHMRIQLILKNNDNGRLIGIWLYVGKERGSYYDRFNLKRKLADNNFAARLFEYVRGLGDAYWISIGDANTLEVIDIENADQMKAFLLTDDYSDYFIIGRDYDPAEPDLSIDNIKETVLIEFSKLYKIYDLIKHVCR